MSNSPNDPDHVPETIWSQVESSLYAGRKIQAIKILRQETGVGLKEAKDLVESHERELRKQFPDRFKTKPGGCAGGAVLVFLILLAFFGLGIAI